MNDGDLGEAGIRRLVLLGCGRMGSAMLEGWLARGLEPRQVTVIDPQPSDWLVGLAGHGLALNPEELGEATVAVLAVKPQIMTEAAPRLGPLARGPTLFLSVAAGTPIHAFEEIFGAETPIVRAMPNTPAAIGEGISALIGNARAGEGEMAKAEALMRAVGRTVRLDSEAQMDAVTGLSGSGPAYVFHLIEAMAAAGEAEGLAPDLAMALARGTVAGAGALAGRSAESAERLRANVTSPGGTTAAGLEVLMAELPDLMRRTVRAAAERSRELSE